MRRNPTHQEAVLWQALRANRLEGLHFRRRQVIQGFIADFYCYAIGLVVEVDGPIRVTQEQYDTERDQIFAALDLQVLRVDNDDLERDLPLVLDRIHNAAEATGRLRSPLPSEGRGRG